MRRLYEDQSAQGHALKQPENISEDNYSIKPVIAQAGGAFLPLSLRINCIFLCPGTAEAESFGKIKILSSDSPLLRQKSLTNRTKNGKLIYAGFADAVFPAAYAAQDTQRCLSGRRSTTGNRVYLARVPWVQIPFSAPRKAPEPSFLVQVLFICLTAFSRELFHYFKYLSANKGNTILS